MSKVSRADEAADELMKVLKQESERYETLDDAKARKDSAESMAALAEKVQKLEDTSVTKRSGWRDFFAKIGAIAAEIGLGVAGLVLTQKNIKETREYEEEHVIRGEADKAVTKNALNVNEKRPKVMKVMKW